MKNLKYILVLIPILVGFAACSDYLERDPKTDTYLSYEMIFKDVRLAPGFLNNAYNDLPDGFNRSGSGSMFASACDEAKHSRSGDMIQFFNNNAISITFNPDNVWSSMYAGIRKCNIFLKELDGLITQYNSIPVADRPNFRGQAYFLRAFFHFELLKRYQNIIYVDKVLDPFNEYEIYSFKQSTFAEAVKLIAQDCDSATALLPARLVIDGSHNGRPTKASSMAVKARMLLYAASPLNNPTNDITLWQQAEAACKEIYDQRTAFGLNLMTSFSGIFTTPYNAEIIFATQATNRNDIERANFPISYQGLGLTNPTQDLVDAFAMNSTYYNDPMNGFNPENPYAGREDRFGATILSNNVIFKDSPVESFVGGKDGLNATVTATKTGYYLRKFINPAINLERNELSRRPWILYRYGELILNYAEARNEVLDRPDQLVHDLLNLIRNRARLRPFRNATEYIQTKEEMREYIKKERRVELAMEEHRFWDLRRWKDAEVVLNKPIKGMRIERETTGEDSLGNPVYKFNYTVFEVEQRTFDPKLYWYPIPKFELLKYQTNGINMVQNPGW